MCICGSYEISFKMNPPRRIYKRCWGRNSLSPQLIIAPWMLIAQNIINETFRLMFGLTDVALPLIIGLGAQQHFTKTYCGSCGEITFSPRVTSKSYTLNVSTSRLDPLKLRAFVNIVRVKLLLDSFLTIESS